MNIKVCIGEILDKLSILTIKKHKINEVEKLLNINKEYEYLFGLCDKILNDTNIKKLYNDLYKINEMLWVVEDNIRIKEKNKQFDQEFINYARSVYKYNDIRAAIKKEINTLLKSDFCEEKSYEKY